MSSANDPQAADRGRLPDWATRLRAELRRTLPYWVKHPIRLVVEFCRNSVARVISFPSQVAQALAPLSGMRLSVPTVRSSSPTLQLWAAYIHLACRYLRVVRLALMAQLAGRSVARARGKRVLMLTISAIDIDPRINKVAQSLVANGYQVDIFCFNHAGRNEREIYDAYPGVRYVRIPFDPEWRRMVQFWLIYQDEFYNQGMSWDFDVVHANDLTTLLVGWILARTRRVPLVYDAHEMWSENVYYKNNEWVPMTGRVKTLARWFEGFLVRSVNVFYTVSDSICDEFKSRYKLRRRPLLVANFPEKKLLAQIVPGTKSIRELCNLGDDKFITLYLGGVGPLRNIENVIRAHAHLPDHCVFVIRGPCVEESRPGYEALAKQLGIAHRIFCLPPVGREDVLGGAIGADCGVVMLKNLCNNFYWFYPNKFFEYMLAGLPVGVSEFPDVKAHIERENCGVTFDPESPTSIAQALGKLAADPAEARRKGERGRDTILARYNWDTATEILMEGYKEIAPRV